MLLIDAAWHYNSICAQPLARGAFLRVWGYLNVVKSTLQAGFSLIRTMRSYPREIRYLSLFVL